MTDVGDTEFVLLQHPPAWDLPSSNVDCIRLHAYLRLAVVPYRVENCLNQPDSEQLPALERGAQVAYANVDDGGVGFLREHCNIDLDAALQEGERAELHAFTALVDSVLADASLFEFWMEPQNANVAGEMYASMLPWPLRSILTWQKQFAVKRYFEAKGLALRPAEVYDKAAAAYSDLAVRLGNQTQFFAERPSSLDAAVYAHLIFHLQAPLKHASLKAEIEKYPNLVKFAGTLQSRLFGSLPPPEAPPFTRTQGQPRARSRRAAGGAAEGEQKKDDKTLALHRRARYFLLAQAATILTYILFSSLSIEIEEEDVDDDDDEDGDM